MTDAVLPSTRSLPAAPRSPAAATASPPPPSPDAVPPLRAPNPRLSYDYAVGMVVMEFQDSSGQTRSSIPSERELNAYRRAVLRGGELPGAATVAPDGTEADGTED